MYKEMLTASGKELNCYASERFNIFDYKDTINDEIDLVDKVYDLGFLVVKDVISKELIKKSRDVYFSLFKSREYIKQRNEWIHIKNHKDLHGCGNHPSKLFLQSNELWNVVNSEKLKKVSNKLLNTKNTIISPRIIVRSFSKLSYKHTYAHRDMEYYKSPNIRKVITCWIPLGPADVNHGQLIYLEESHKRQNAISKLVKRDKIISENLNKLSDKFRLRWIRPILNEGDVIFHSLEIVHSSFESKSIFPRLSIDIRFAASDSDLDPKWSTSWRGDDGL